MIQIKLHAGDISPDDIKLHIVPVRTKATPFVWLSVGPVDIYLTPVTAAKILNEIGQLIPGNLGAEPEQPVKGADPT